MGDPLETLLLESREVEQLDTLERVRRALGKDAPIEYETIRQELTQCYEIENAARAFMALAEVEFAGHLNDKRAHVWPLWSSLATLRELLKRSQTRAHKVEASS